MTEPTRRFGWKALAQSAPLAARVLVVDDEPAVRKSLERMVSSLGYEVRAAASSEEADHWLGAERFDVMLLDVELPRMKGVEFLSWALERDSQLAVLMLTGLDDPELAIECIERGARTYLVKPVELDFLRLAIRDALMVRHLLVHHNPL